MLVVTSQPESVGMVILHLLKFFRNFGIPSHLISCRTRCLIVSPLLLGSNHLSFLSSVLMLKSLRDAVTPDRRPGIASATSKVSSLQIVVSPSLQPSIFSGQTLVNPSPHTVLGVRHIQSGHIQSRGLSGLVQLHPLQSQSYVAAAPIQTCRYRQTRSVIMLILVVLMAITGTSCVQTYNP